MEEPPSGRPESRKKRCHSGCAICRARKVKCDERPGGCSNCERFQLKCPGNDLDHLPPVRDLRLPASAGVKRKKTYRSCAQCRSSKTKCSGDRPTCLRCARKQTECAYDSNTDPAWARVVFRDPSNWAGSEQPEQSSDSEIEDPSKRGSANLNHVGSMTNHVTNHEPLADSVQGAVWNTRAWLHTKRLPDKEKLFVLIDQYFANVHPLRCFSFIHKPSFMQRLDEGLTANSASNALLFTVCALGAKFYAVEYSVNTERLLPDEVLAAGNKWAREAQRLICSDLDIVSVENLMAAVLLHDHELRVGRFQSAFMLAGVSARMAQALQVNVEYSTDILYTQTSTGPSPAAREARRRLMWGCYVMDAWVGSGVDQLTLLDDADVKVQLPCNDQHFVRQTPAITETLEPGRVLKFLSNESPEANPKANMGMAAYFVRLTSYRKKVLRFVKHLDVAQPPWLHESEFSHHDNNLRQWLDTLPTTLKFTTSAQYIRKDSSQLGALCLLHCTYHQTMCDLYRIGMPRLFKIRTKIHYPPEKLEFLAWVQQTCFYHAQQIAKSLQTASRHGVKTLADTWLTVIAHDGNRVMLYYLTKVIEPTADSNRLVVNETLELVRSNLDVLQAMIPLFSMSKNLYEASANMVRQSGLGDQLTKRLLNPDEVGGNVIEGPTAPNTPIQSTPEYVLNPLAIYRLARKTVPDKEKHAPELIPSPEAYGAASDMGGSPSWCEPNIPSQLFQTQQASPFANAAGLPPICTPRSIPIAGSDAGDLQMFFSSDFDTIWQPAETILESSRWGGMAPWESDARPRIGSGLGDLDMFMPNYTWPLHDS